MKENPKMRYLPQTKEDIRRMLEAIGVESIEALFQQIPESLRLNRALDIPSAMSEPELIEEMNRLAEKNETKGFTSFLGAGVYDHFAPSMVDHILRRSEFYTAYTPYQPEVSQGTLQAIFEYQTLMSLLLEAEVTNASMYDGASATAEAALMAKRVKRKKKKVLIAENVHPDYRRVTQTYMVDMADDLVTVAFDEATGRIDLADLESKLDDAACLIVGHPNYFGIFEDLPKLEALVHDADALFVVTFSEPFAFGLATPPGRFGADIIAGEGQSFLGAMNFGGPGLGIFSTRKKLVRQMPGRVCGMTVDADGERSFVLTLSTREQHIRREKATSNICTNQGLCALSATIFLSVMGKAGLKEVARLNFQKAQYAKAKLSAIDGVELAFDRPTFNEFVIKTTKKPAADLRCDIYGEKILAGLDLKTDYPALDSHLLLTVTEKTKKQDIDRLAKYFETL